MILYLYTVSIYGFWLVFGENIRIMLNNLKNSWDMSNQEKNYLYYSNQILIDPLFKDCDFEREGWSEKFRK